MWKSAYVIDFAVVSAWISRSLIQRYPFALNIPSSAIKSALISMQIES